MTAIKTLLLALIDHKFMNIIQSYVYVGISLVVLIKQEETLKKDNRSRLSGNRCQLGVLLNIFWYLLLSVVDFIARLLSVY